MRPVIVAGIAGGAAFSAWSLATMLWPVPYSVWDVGRGIIFVSFMAALIGLAASVARSSQSLRRTFGSVSIAALLCAGFTLATYAGSTRFLADRIVQLPEYLRDYTHHGYTSPEAYLEANYSALLQLQIFSWTVGVLALLVVAGTTGWFLRLAWRPLPWPALD